MSTGPPSSRPERRGSSYRRPPASLLGALACLPPFLVGGAAAAGDPADLAAARRVPLPPQDEAALRQLAAALFQSDAPDEAARAWARVATLEDKQLLLLAGLRAWDQDPRLADLALLGLEAGLPAAYASLRWVGDSAAVDEELRQRLARLSQHPEALLELCWRRGVAPAAEAPSELREAYRAAAHRLAAEGVLPRRDLRRGFTFLDRPSQLLLPIVGHRLPDREIAGLLRVDAGQWAADEQLLLDLVLLDHGAVASPAPSLLQLWERLRRLAGPAESWTPMDLALFRGLQRHAPALPPAFPGAEPWGAYPDGAIRQFLLREAPLGRTSELLLGALKDPRLAVADRKASAVRLLRGAGERMAPEVLPLLSGDLPDELAEFLIIGLQPFEDERLGEILARRATPFGGAATRPALQHRLRSSERAERLRLLPQVLRLPAAERFGTARAAWDADPCDELLAAFQSWTRSPDPTVQRLARRLLQLAASEQEVADFYQDRLAAEPDPRLRDLLVQSVRELRGDAGLEVFLRWLDSPEGRAHPKCGERAFLVVPEAAAKPVFERWWQEQESLTPSQVDVAAAALATERRDAREYLYGRLPSFPANLQVVLLDRLVEGSGPGDYQRWQQGFLDRLADPAVRRAYAICLAKGLGASRPTVDELLGFFAGKARLGVLPEGPWQHLIEATIAYASPDHRSEVVALSRSAEAGLEREAVFVAVARLRGMVRDPLPEEAGPLTQELLDLLLGAAPPTAPGPAAPDPAGVRSRNPQLYFCGLALASHGEAVDGELAARLSAGDRASEWAPERLWMLTDPVKVGGRLPLTAAAAREWLDALVPPESGFHRARKRWQELPAWHWTDFSRVAAELQSRLLAAEPESGTSRLLETAQLRWPEDRRAYDYAGWFAVAEGRLDEAAVSFQLSRRRSGSNAMTQREPLLGLAVVEELLHPGSGAVQAFLEGDPGAAPLLPHRLAVGLRPELKALIPTAQD